MELNNINFRPHQRLTLRNKTDRTLHLEWSGDIHEPDGNTSILLPGTEDSKRSKRTDDATFKIKVKRGKNGQLIDSGSFNEYISSGPLDTDGESKTHELKTLKLQEGKLTLSTVDQDGHLQQTIQAFPENEW
ncbi:hypothetical protein [Bacillus cereus]|uniref:hypothetical protein n=1 Tax=Bacillus cereus TaxID=1396 RepID=UPI00204245A5|nr:hypothetical protein [Bacillus cereus]MCM3202707.1 hypothetical protein [Bacillus cereus]